MLWKLLRRHISVAQIAGFAAASLVGTTIVLLTLQLYADLRPALSGRDSVMKSAYVILSRQASAEGAAAVISDDDLAELASQRFAVRVAPFTAAAYGVEAALTMGEMRVATRMFLESVPDDFLDIEWPKMTTEADVTALQGTAAATTAAGVSPSSSTATAEVWQGEVPIIVPRSYLSLYNFGFAPSQRLPKLTEGLMGLLRLELRLTGEDGRVVVLPARVVGLTSRINTMLVPQRFMDWSNAVLAGNRRLECSRVIMEVRAGGTDDAIAVYARDHGLVVDDGSLDASRATYLLRSLALIVVAIGLIISVLAIYLLMLSVSLLLQKNRDRIDTLLLLGYEPWRVALPYQLLTLGLSAGVTALALGITMTARRLYLNYLWAMLPTLQEGPVLTTLVAAAVLCLGVAALHAVVIRRQV